MAIDAKLFIDRLHEFEIACRQMECVPETLFARGKMNGRGTLLMVSGPTFTLESLEIFRTEVLECLDAKEKQLKGNSDPGTAIVHW